MFPVVLDNRLWFPDPRRATKEGLVAIGGDLSAERLLLAYRHGLFPWTENPVTWWSPDPRGIIELDRVHIPRSLSRTMRKRTFDLTLDRDFRGVMLGCAEPAPGRGETWISPGFVEAYTRLHEAGHAHSLECWSKARLVGGIYGVAVGGFFAGESMFHREDDASKVALISLAEHLLERGFKLFDVQMVTPITRRLGAIETPRRRYLERLAAAVALECTF